MSLERKRERSATRRLGMSLPGRAEAGSKVPARLAALHCGVFHKATGPCFLNAAFALAECSELLAAGRIAGGRGPGLPGRRVQTCPRAPHPAPSSGMPLDDTLIERDCAGL